MINTDVLTIYLQLLIVQTKIKRRWLSGRKRQTVNLLGNSHWFEPNSSQFMIPKVNYKSFYKDLYFNKLQNFGEVFTKNGITNVKISNKQSLSSFNKITPFLNKSLFYSKQLQNYTFIDKGYNLNRRKFFNPTKVLALNFSRNKFFPVIRTILGESYFFLSLGILSKFLLKNKAFTKSKTVFILLASFLRKVLLFSSVKNMYLFINKTPLYFKEIMSTINDPVVSVYKNPFSNSMVNEKELPNPFTFPLIIFTNNKPYGFLKTKQKGRLKRKISRRLVMINRVLDQTNIELSDQYTQYTVDFTQIFYYEFDCGSE